MSPRCAFLDMHQVSHLVEKTKLPQIRKHEIPAQSMTNGLDIWLGDWKEKNKTKQNKTTKTNKTKKAEMYRQRKCRQRRAL